MRLILLAAAVSLAASLAVAAPRPCPAGLRPATVAQLFFGENLAGGDQVSDADWRGFLSAEISPRFPDGLTVADVYGQWRGPNGDFVKEPSKALLLVLSGSDDDLRRINLIRSAYKREFHQDSVLLVEQRACAGF